MMNRIAFIFGSRWAIAIAVSLGGLALGACTPNTPLTEAEIDRGHQFRPPYRVDHTVHEYLIPVNATKIEIDEHQFRDLYEYLIGVGAQTGDSIVLAARRSRLEQRVQVHEFLRRVGLKPEVKLIKDLDAGSEDDGYNNAILIRYDRYVPHHYECGKWGEKVKVNYHSTSLRNFGCASTNALQQQVAYPSTLIEGQLLDFPEGDFAAEAVSRYRGRKVEDIKPETVGGG